MKIGASTDFTRISYVKEAGFDYLELSLYAVSRLSDEEFKQRTKELEALGLKVEAFNGFFGPEICILGENRDLDAAKQYVKKAFARAKILGGEIVVLGSGGARRVPQGYDRTKALEELDEVIKMLGDEAEKAGLTVVLEHLNYKETDTLNTLAEVLETVKRVNHPRVKALVDFYHLFMVNESLDSVKNSEGLIYHAHLARANPDRKIPDRNDTQPIYDWKKSLDACGYNARISIEASPRGEGTYPADIKEARKVMEIFK